jgi:ubiquinone/menaquinone biosynthesis C-methylase UbiE
MKMSTDVAVERLDSAQSEDALQLALHRQRYEFALARIGPDDSLLEVGTGAGCFSEMVLGKCKDFTGLEYDPGAFQTTSKRLQGHGKVVQGDAQALPFPSESFSVIVCLEVLEHLHNYRQAVSEIHRCLKPEGHVIVSVPYRRRGGTNPGNRFHIYEPGEAELVEAFRRHFSEVDVFYQYFKETTLMTCARILHLRSVLGLATIYRDLTMGTPESIAKLLIAAQPGGLVLNLLLVARGRQRQGSA